MKPHELRPLLALLAASLTGPASASDLMAADRGLVSAPTPGANDRMGEVIALDGEWAVVGVPSDDGPGVNSGTAYVYKRTATGWSAYQVLTPSALDEGDLFGQSVAIRDDLIVVGAPGSDVVTAYAGAAFVFALHPQTQTWMEIATLTDPEAAYADWSGSGVALNEAFIAVGACWDDGTQSNSGSVGFWLRDGKGTSESTDDTWSHAQRLQATPEVHGGGFGTQLDMDGDRLAVGAPNDGYGAAYVVELHGSAWVQTQKLVDPQPNGGADFGDDVALDGATLVIGCPGKDLTFAYQGAAFVYESASGPFVQTGLLYNPLGAASDSFGSDVGISAGVVCVGAKGVDAHGLTDAGEAYLFSLSAMGWELQERFLATVPENAGWFGDGVAIDHGRILVGASRSDLGGSNSGAAFAYAIGTGSFSRFGPCDGSGAAAPCGNESLAGAGEGCLNSTGRGARLSASGSDDADVDDISVSATGLLPFQPALLFTGTDSYSYGIPFGDGLRVATGDNVRRGVALPDGQGLAIWGPGLGSGMHGWSSGMTLTFQAWYRDPFASPCGSSFNFTSGLTVDFQ